MKRITIIASAILFCCAIAPDMSAARGIDLAVLRTVVRVSQPQISPDGKHIAFIKTTSDFVKNKRASQLLLLDVASGATRPLTYDRTGLDSPRWSPSGDRLAFIADAGTGDGAQSQIFVLPMNGGDPLQATKAKNGVEQFAWKPDGSAFAYITADDAPNKKQIDKHFDAFDVGDLDYKADAAPVPSHLWLVSATGKGARRLTSGSWSLSSVNGGAGGPISWSADGKTIAITKLPDAVAGDSDTAVSALVNAKTGAVRDLPGQRPFMIAPLLAPTGNMVASLWFPHGAFNSNGYLVATTATGGPIRVIGGQEHNVDWYDWAPDGQSIAFAAEDGPMTGLWVAGLDGATRRFATGSVNFGGEAVTGPHGAIAFVGNSPTEPGEIYYFASPSSSLRRLTKYNASFEKLSLGEKREVRWTGPGGFAEDGIVTLPPGYSASKRYPLALVIHGGPQGSSQLSFDSLPQLIAAHGIVAFEPNYRGSTNLGFEPIGLYRVVEAGSDAPRRRSRAVSPRTVWLAAGALLTLVALAAVLGPGSRWLSANGASTPSPSGGSPAESSGAVASPGASTVAVASPGASPGAGALTGAERALLARIPLDFQAYCRRSSVPDGSAGGVVGLRCDLPADSTGYGADSVWYDTFDTRGEMVLAVNTITGREALKPGDCAASATGAQGRWSLGTTFTGQLACYQKSGGVWWLWSYEGDQILARAVRLDGDPVALRAWWHDRAAGWLR